jgi:PhzF family phenazine biosynthesis protein
MKVYVVNAFTKDKFGGNPAAVVPLQEWLADDILQQIANQHNLSETAYIIPQEGEFAIRWFTPTVEVDLCGHATLASAHIFFTKLGYPSDKIRFHSRSGPLDAHRGTGGRITLDFPAYDPVEVDPLPAIETGLKTKPLAVYQSVFDYMAVFRDQQTIEDLSPDFGVLASIPVRGLIATAPGRQSDFVSRCFFPQSGIDEDPATGSAHSVMTPYWARKLGKNKLHAIQLSKRRGELVCEWSGDRVFISGNAVTYLEGEILI